MTAQHLMSGRRLARWLSPFALLAVPALLATAACQEPEAYAPEEPTTEIDDVEDAPFTYAGRQIRVVGEVEEMASGRVFELEGNDWLFDAGLLVLSAQPVRFGPAMPLIEDDEVVVEGTVHTFATAEIERELGWDVDPEIEVEWSGEPVLVAESVRRVGDYGYWAAEDAPEGRVVGFASVYEAPERAGLAGTPIAITSVPMVRRAGERGLWVGFDQEASLFVQAPEDVAIDGFAQGAELTIAGTLASVPDAMAARERWNLDDEAAERLAEDGVYLPASVIEPAPERATRGQITLREVGAAPADHVGQRLSTEATVTEVISDRAFYLDAAGGERVLAVVREDVPRHEMIDIDAGQRLRFDAQIHASADPLAGTLEADAREAIGAQPAFLSMHWRDVEILEPVGG